ncbi:MAG: heme peroxidase family protein [Caldilineaceae bacterium]
MQRMSHGDVVSLERVQAAREQLDALNQSLAMPIAFAAPRRLTDFGYMFAKLQDNDANLLPAGQATVDNLKRLGQSMRDHAPEDASNSTIPSAYTFLGQFIDHDITLELASDDFGELDSPEVLDAMEKVLQRVKNERTATLDLDSVYGTPAPFNGERMQLGPVFPSGKPVPGKDMYNDLPRSPRDHDMKFDRFALIGDARNDENLVIAQLHLAFLRAHNALVDRGHTWESARRVLQQLYQWVVVEDFLVRIVGRRVVDRVKQGSQFFKPTDTNFFMPLEFSVAAYRFGHSLVRNRHDYNLHYPTADFNDLFTYTALSGQIGEKIGEEPIEESGYDELPRDRVIQWERFVDVNPNPARLIDTRLVEPLFELRNELGIVHGGVDALLAVRNLLRGYKLRIPTGQAVACAMSLSPLDPAALRNLIRVNAERAGMNDADKDALMNAGFDMHTPLWFYILAEAELLEGGMHLGPVGGTIVAEVIIEMIRRSANSIFEFDGDWNPSQLSGALEQQVDSTFNLSDLLRLGCAVMVTIS